MIGRLSGKLLSQQATWLLLDVAGIGYELEAPMSTIYALPEPGQTTVLHTHLLVRDDAHLLFGFATMAERSLFRALLKVSGIGAKMALAILSTMSVAQFAAVIANGDADQLVRVPGIGKKTASRVVLELKGSLAGVDAAGSGESPGGTTDARAEATEALQALGYSAAEARRLVDKTEASLPDAQAVIRAALQRAAR